MGAIMSGIAAMTAFYMFRLYYVIFWGILNYSSVSYLSAQFKHVTGMTPSHFKKIKGNKRKPLDEI